MSFRVGSEVVAKEWWANRFICRGLFSFSSSWAAFSVIHVHENCACDLLAIFLLAIYSLFVKWKIQDNKRTGWKRNWHVHFTKPTFSRLFIKQTTASSLRWKSIIALSAFQEPCLWYAKTNKQTDRNKRSSISIHQSIFFWLVYFKVKRMWLYSESLIKFCPCNEFHEKKTPYNSPSKHCNVIVVWLKCTQWLRFDVLLKRDLFLLVQLNENWKIGNWFDQSNRKQRQRWKRELQTSIDTYIPNKWINKVFVWIGRKGKPKIF